MLCFHYVVILPPLSPMHPFAGRENKFCYKLKGMNSWTQAGRLHKEAGNSCRFPPSETVCKVILGVNFKYLFFSLKLLGYYRLTLVTDRWKARFPSAQKQRRLFCEFLISPLLYPHRSVIQKPSHQDKGRLYFPSWSTELSAPAL